MVFQVFGPVLRWLQKHYMRNVFKKSMFPGPTFKNSNSLCLEWTRGICIYKVLPRKSLCAARLETGGPGFRAGKA